jgi:hypothetical protein
MFRYLVLAALFFVLSPGNYLTLPRGGSKRTVALVHATVFVVAYYLSEKIAEMLSLKVPEGFRMELGPMLEAPTFTVTKITTPTTKPGTKSTTRPPYTQPTTKPPNPATQALAAARIAYFRCDGLKADKNIEYRISGDNSERFQYLDREQGKACDRANDAINTLNKLGIRFEAPTKDAAMNLYTIYRSQCDMYRQEKDEEYRISGDNSERFQFLDRLQGIYCDARNDAENRLKELGISTSFYTGAMGALAW